MRSQSTEAKHREGTCKTRDTGDWLACLHLILRVLSGEGERGKKEQELRSSE